MLSERGTHVLHRVVVDTALSGAREILVTIVVVGIVAICTLLLDRASVEDLDFATEDHLEGLAADGLVDTRETRAVAPFVELATEGV